MSAGAFKACRCCGREYSLSPWRELAYVGIQDDGVEALELRNCACGSTLAIELGPGATMLLDLEALFRLEANKASDVDEADRLDDIADEIHQRADVLERRALLDSDPPPSKRAA
jgi:hypothetical protein